jgi:hypothetical protein
MQLRSGNQYQLKVNDENVVSNKVKKIIKIKKNDDMINYFNPIFNDYISSFHKIQPNSDNNNDTFLEKAKLICKLYKFINDDYQRFHNAIFQNRSTENYIKLSIFYKKAFELMQDIKNKIADNIEQVKIKCISLTELNHFVENVNNNCEF